MFNDDTPIKYNFYKYKEYALLKRWQQKSTIDPNEINTTLPTENIPIINYTSPQLFVSRFLNPHSEFKKLHILWQTGQGKTIAALKIASEFIKSFVLMKDNKYENIGTVFILGFSKSVFYKELLSRPEFGFITLEEIQKLKKYKSLATLNNLRDIEIYKRFLIKLKKRFSNRKNIGFFKFYGYKELVNLKNDPEFLKQFTSNSLIICDEFHNTYNSIEKNNYGDTIKFILQQSPDIYFLTMSATIMLNSPTEIIDLLNIHHPDKNYQKSDFFTPQETLTPQGITSLVQITKNMFSYVEDITNISYPAIIQEGSYIPGIDLLKFIKCPMSDYQISQYKKALTQNNLLNIESHHVLDIAFPENKTLDTDLLNSTKIITGDFLKVPNLKNYSSKNYQLLNIIANIIKNKQGKILVYNNYVNTFGILLNEEVLKLNGFISYTDTPHSNTICMECGLKKSDHSGTTTHNFIPAKYAVVHGLIPKHKLDSIIDKFSSPENTFGHQIYILLGSKVIKESYDLKAVQNVIFMNRPDNIPTFIQIRGRAVRRNSHILLPEKNRVVHIYILVSSLPGNALSYEENKYKEKIQVFKTIQQIEKILHQNAIDNMLNYINKKPLDTISQNNDPLAHLPYNTPVYENLPLEKLNLSEFNPYYAKEEITAIKIIIKRMFVEISTVWNHTDLFEKIKSLQSYTSYNVNLFSEQNFNIAISQLCINPEYTNITLSSNDPLTSIFSPDEKIICIPPENKLYTIIPIVENLTQWYFLIPFGKPLTFEIPYRKVETPEPFISLNTFVAEKKVDFDYIEKRNLFYRRFVDVSIEYMESVVCEYGTLFHIKFLEECIEYIFNVWTNPEIIKSVYHDFYFKMLYYYDLLNLVIWAHTCKPVVAKMYEKYVIPVNSTDIKLKILNKYEKRQDEIQDISPDSSSDLATSGIINLLKSTYNRTSNNWIPQDFIENYYKTIEQSLLLFHNTKKKSKNQTKISAQFLPVGHYISKFPRIFNPVKGWVEMPEYLNSEISYIENDLIIGFDVKSENGTHVRFKLRPPLQDIKHFKDARKIEKGTSCKSKSKAQLLKLIKDLDIIIDDNENVDNLCQLIKAKLIRNELKERIKKSNIKWFYQHYEQQPII